VDLGGGIPGWLDGVFRVSQLLYLGTVLVVGGRLLWLSRRTGGLPERLLGVQFVVGSGIAWPILITAILSIVPGQTPPPHVQWMIGLGHLGLDATLLCQLLFVKVVFRANERWASVLVGFLAVYVAVTYTALGLSGHFQAPVLDGLWYWLHYLTPAFASCWMTFEAFHYYGAMRRRLQLGLADAVITNRFLLWGSASACGMTIVILGASPVFYVGLDPEAVRAISSVVLSAMSLLGCAAVVLFWLTFFPTRAYLAWIERRTASA